MAYLNDEWFERAYEALNETLRVDKSVRKQMIQFLFDEGMWDEATLSWQAAETRFTGALNRNKTDTNFKLGELWALMKQFGRHHFALAMMEDLGYECRLKSTEERRQDLLVRALDALERNETLTAGLRADIQRLTSGEVSEEPVRSPGGRRPSFSLRQGP